VAHIQIRNVPPDVHRTFKARAAKAGMSLQEYLLGELTEAAARPTIEELTERIRRRGPVQTKTDPADIIREDRDSR
jgi:plasmid stability protein